MAMIAQIVDTLIRGDLSLLKADGSINQQAAARAFCINQPTLFRLLSGETIEPRTKVVEAIAKYFSLEPAQLRGEKAIPGLTFSGADPSEHLTKDESLLLSIYRALSPAMKKTAVRVVAALNG